MNAIRRMWARLTHLGQAGQVFLFGAILCFTVAILEVLHPLAPTGRGAFLLDGIFRLFGGRGMVVAFTLLGCLFVWIALTAPDRKE